MLLSKGHVGHILNLLWQTCEISTLLRICEKKHGKKQLNGLFQFAHLDITNHI